ncbi:MAG TPA: YceI family protein, partial [Cyclobacteriaceae bacterium]
MKSLRNVLVLCMVAMLLNACAVKNEAKDVMKEVGELKESVVETGGEMVDGAKKAVDDAKEALDKAGDKIGEVVDGVGESVAKAKESVENLVPSGDMEDGVEPSVEATDEGIEAPVDGAFNYESGNLKWKAEKIGGMHEGLIDITSGNVVVANSKVTNGTFVIDMTTINTTDLEGDSKADLEAKFQEEGYFDIVNHPTATLNITEVIDGGVKGDLTIKGITNPVEFPAEIIVKAEKVIIGAEFTIDRTLWEIASGNPVIKK